MSLKAHFMLKLAFSVTIPVLLVSAPVLAQEHPGNWWINPNSGQVEFLDRIVPSRNTSNILDGSIEDIIDIQFTDVQSERSFDGSIEQFAVGTLTNRGDSELSFAQLSYEDIQNVDGSERIIGGDTVSIEVSTLYPGQSSPFRLPFRGSHLRLIAIETLYGSAPLNKEYRPNR